MLISVIIPAYNAETYLPETVRSVQNQTHSDWELVVVDDGSTDGTGGLVDALAAQEPRVRAVHQGNGGLSAARNAGLRTASRGAEFVLFLDADDVLEPDALETLGTHLAARPQAPAAYGLACFIDGRGNRTRPGEAEEFGRTRQGIRGGRPVDLATEDATSFAVLAYRNVIWTPGQVLIRRAALDRAGAFDVTMSPTADWDMWLRISQQGEMPLIERVVLSYRRHEHNMSGSGQNMRAAEMMMRAKAFQSPGLTTEQRRAVLDGFQHSERGSAVQWWGWAWNALLRGRRREALRNLGIAAKYYRWSLGTPLSGEKFSD